MRARRLVIIDAAGEPLATLDLTGIMNANTAAVMQAVIEQQCDQGFWHQGQSVNLTPWGSD